jgi:diguanylate cyclase (GGDEF)-like protein
LEDEETRLKALTAYGLSADWALPDLDPVVNIAARVLNMPFAAVNMIGADHVFFAASTGFGAADLDMRRGVSFCGHAIAQDGVLIVPDAALDERFKENPLVTGPAGIRFYAGVPLRSPQGHAIGALCVIDQKPHHDFSHDDEIRLRELAKMAADRLELRRVEVAAHQSPAIASPESDGHDEEIEVRRLANTDTLTGLPNRLSVCRQTEKKLAETGRAGVILLDLDGFKEVNNELGCLAGDHLLCEVAQRLLKATGANGMVARLGGDEFVILLEGEINHERAMCVARSAISAVAEPIVANGQEVRITACCGVAIAPIHASEALELINNADLALARAKSTGRAQSFVFVPELRTKVIARRLSNIELDRAVNNGEFVLFYQPQVRLTDGSLTGAEALIRWWHPQRGLLSPGAFLPALESGPLASIAGAWVLDQACAQAALWRRRGAHDFRIGVNLFSIQLRVGDLVTDVMSALERHGLPPEALELEITENTALERDTCASEALQRLRQYGVGVAFDDFGTGYASLSSLKRYPVSRLKIDRSFVQGMLGSKEDAAVVRAILGMARSFRMETIAEGVENEQQRKALWELGCSEGQGYLFGRPLSASRFDEIFRMGQQGPALRGTRAVPHDNDGQHHKTSFRTVSRS